jgi:hypothetical protein
VAEEVTDFARRRPLVFLAGAGAAGFLVGRMIKNGRSSTTATDDDSYPRAAPAVSYPAATPEAPTPLGDGEEFPPRLSGGLA